MKKLIKKFKNIFHNKKDKNPFSYKKAKIIREPGRGGLGIVYEVDIALQKRNVIRCAMKEVEIKH